jgi:hypothetical protein
VNPIYSIMESPNRWLVLAGIAFVAGTIGAMMMLAYAWPHWLDRLWLIAGLVATVVFLILALRDWLTDVRGEATPEQRRSPGARLR